MNNPVYENCKVCGRTYQLGVDGVRGNLCDDHAGVIRDKQGHAWFQGEMEHIFDNGTRITRKDAGVNDG